MRNYIDNEDDISLFIDIYNRPETTQFFDEHKEQILPIILDKLNDSSETTRSIAIGYLRKITGQNFGFQTEKKDGQKQIIQQWKNFIETEY